jgi:hypothetical protein
MSTQPATLYPPLYDPQLFVEKSKHYGAIKIEGQYQAYYTENKDELVDLNTLPKSTADHIRELEKLKEQLPDIPVPDSQAKDTSKKIEAEVKPIELSGIKRAKPEKLELPIVEDAEEKEAEPPLKKQKTEKEPATIHEALDATLNAPGASATVKELAKAIEMALNSSEDTPAQVSRVFSRSLRHKVEQTVVISPSGTTDVDYKIRPVAPGETPSDLEGLPPDVVERVNQLDTQELNENT